MKFLKLVFASLSVVILLGACSSLDQARKKKQKEKKGFTRDEYLESIKPDLAKFLPENEASAKKFAASHAGNFYKALKNNDYESFRKSKKMSKQNFKKWHEAITKEYGKLKSKSYVGAKAKPLIMRYMWKWNFKKNKMGTNFDRQILYNVFVVKYKNKNNYDLFFVGPE